MISGIFWIIIFSAIAFKAFVFAQQCGSSLTDELPTEDDMPLTWIIALTSPKDLNEIKELPQRERNLYRLGSLTIGFGCIAGIVWSILEICEVSDFIVYPVIFITGLLLIIGAIIIGSTIRMTKRRSAI